jgi:hypothetical protein
MARIKRGAARVTDRQGLGSDKGCVSRRLRRLQSDASETELTLQRLLEA